MRRKTSHNATLGLAQSVATALPLSASSLTAEVYERLRRDLLACRLAPGQRLNIAELAGTISVSLGAVREALSRLTSEGLVVLEPQKGFTAAPISAADLADLTQVRIRIECQCLRRSIEVGSLAWETTLVAAHHRLARTPASSPGDPSRMADEWALYHAEFHEALAAGCDSPWSLKLRRTLFAHSERYRRLSLPLGRKPRRVDQEHAALVAAALARDADSAERLLTAHLQTTAAALLKLEAIVQDRSEASSAATQTSKQPRRRAKPPRRAGSAR